jgi:hypothetical protein
MVAGRDSSKHDFQSNDGWSSKHVWTIPYHFLLLIQQGVDIHVQQLLLAIRKNPDTPWAKLENLDR